MRSCAAASTTRHHVFSCQRRAALSRYNLRRAKRGERSLPTVLLLRCHAVSHAAALFTQVSRSPNGGYAASPPAGVLPKQAGEAESRRRNAWHASDNALSECLLSSAVRPPLPLRQSSASRLVRYGVASFALPVLVDKAVAERATAGAMSARQRQGDGMR